MKFFWKVNIDSRTCKTSKCCWQFVKRNWQFLHQLATILGPAPFSFLQAGCPSWRPTNSVKALKGWALKAQHYTKSVRERWNCRTGHCWIGHWRTGQWRTNVWAANTHTHTRLTALCLGLPGWAGTRKVKPIWILLKQETVSGSGISWTICKSAPRSRQPHQHPTTQFFTGRVPSNTHCMFIVFAYQREFHMS